MSEYMPPPQIQTLAEILPTEPLLLMGAGPVPISHAVSQANGVVINHLGETMDQVIHSLKSMAAYAFQTRSTKILGVAGPSSAAMEMAVTSLLWSQRNALVLKIGTFSGRLGEMARRIGANVTLIEAEVGNPIFPEMVEKALQEKQYDVVTLVQGETSCGVHNFELVEIVRLAKAHGALVIVDAVCTLTTMPMKMDDWGVDVVVTGGQKGLSSIPGIALIAFSENAWEVMKTCPKPKPHWCLDAELAQEFWGHQKYHYTAPVPGILALHESLRQICEETLEHRFRRHLISSTALQVGIETMGLHLFISEKWRLNSVVAIDLPKEVNSASMRKYMSDTFQVEISGAFGLDIVRIGQMGEQCRSQNIFKVLYAMGMAFKHEGYELDVSAGMANLEKNLAQDSENFVN